MEEKKSVIFAIHLSFVDTYLSLCSFSHPFEIEIGKNKYREENRHLSVSSSSREKKFF
jgi:hypothetical protein